MHAITKEYRRRLDKLMFAVSAAVEAGWQSSPLFHIFSETVEPCPAEETGAFDELPDCPLEGNEVRRLGLKIGKSSNSRDIGSDFVGCVQKLSGFVDDYNVYTPRSTRDPNIIIINSITRSLPR